MLGVRAPVGHRFCFRVSGGCRAWAALLLVEPVPGPSLHRVCVRINRFLAPLRPQCRLRQLQHRVDRELPLLRLQRYDLLLSPIP